jgi:hypothetical protein
MDCTFQCSAATHLTNHTTYPVRFPADGDDSPLDSFDALSAYMVPTPGISLAPAYAHGYCSFKLQLMQQCLFTPTENWHNEMLGNIFSIQDSAGNTAVSYPSGAGCIDNRIKLLTGMGDGLYITHQDNKVWFKFDGGKWDTSTQDDGNAYGLCNWGKWSRMEWGCEERFAEERRISDIVCVFKC